jgi:hypothetical protein
MDYYGVFDLPMPPEPIAGWTAPVVWTGQQQRGMG